MGRKIRHYNSSLYYKTLFNDYFKTHRYEVIKEMLEQTGFNTMDELTENEFKMYFGFDCGLVYGEPINKEMKHEWELDNGKYDAKFYCHDMPYNSQSTTLQAIQMNKAIKDLGLSNTIQTYTWID